MQMNTQILPGLIYNQKGRKTASGSAGLGVISKETQRAMATSTNLVLEFLRCQLIMLHYHTKRLGAFGDEEQHVIQDVQFINQVLTLRAVFNNKPCELLFHDLTEDISVGIIINKLLAVHDFSLFEDENTVQGDVETPDGVSDRYHSERELWEVFDHVVEQLCYFFL